MKFMPKLILEQAEENDGTGGSGYSDPGAEGQQGGQENEKKVEEEGDATDEHGYVIDPKAKSSEEEKDDSKEEKSDKKEEEVADPSTGYDKEPKVDERSEKENDDSKAENEEEGKEKFEVKDLDLKGMKEDSDEVKAVSELVKEFELNKDQAQKLVDKYKAIADSKSTAEADRKRAIQQRHANWFKELKEDKDFGGDNFKENVTYAERIIADFMSPYKKALTEQGGMVPPMIMRGLAEIGKQLYGNREFVGGKPGSQHQGEEDKGNDPLDFYTKKAN